MYAVQTGTRLPPGLSDRVDDLQQVRRLNPGPGVRGRLLLSIASHYSLADIDVDVVGLRPVASLFFLSTKCMQDPLRLRLQLRRRRRAIQTPQACHRKARLKGERERTPRKLRAPKNILNFPSSIFGVRAVEISGARVEVATFVRARGRELKEARYCRCCCPHPR